MVYENVSEIKYRTSASHDFDGTSQYNDPYLQWHHGFYNLIVKLL